MRLWFQHSFVSRGSTVAPSEYVHFIVLIGLQKKKYTPFVCCDDGRIRNGSIDLRQPIHHSLNRINDLVVQG